MRPSLSFTRPSQCGAPLSIPIHRGSLGNVSCTTVSDRVGRGVQSVSHAAVCVSGPNRGCFVNLSDDPGKGSTRVSYNASPAGDRRRRRGVDARSGWNESTPGTSVAPPSARGTRFWVYGLAAFALAQTGCESAFRDTLRDVMVGGLSQATCQLSSRRSIYSALRPNKRGSVPEPSSSRSARAGAAATGAWTCVKRKAVSNTCFARRSTNRGPPKMSSVIVSDIGLFRAPNPLDLEGQTDFIPESPPCSTGSIWRVAARAACHSVKAEITIGPTTWSFRSDSYWGDGEGRWGGAGARETSRILTR